MLSAITIIYFNSINFIVAAENTNIYWNQQHLHLSIPRFDVLSWTSLGVQFSGYHTRTSNHNWTYTFIFIGAISKSQSKESNHYWIIFTVEYLQLVVLVIIALIHVTVRPYASKMINVTVRLYASKMINFVDSLILLAMILAIVLQLTEAFNGFTSTTLIGIAYSLILLPILIILVLVVPYKNKQRIKGFVMYFVTSVRPKKAAPSMAIEIFCESNEYQLTVDQALRNTTATTVV